MTELAISLTRKSKLRLFMAVDFKLRNNPDILSFRNNAGSVSYDNVIYHLLLSLQTGNSNVTNFNPCHILKTQH